jgi:hypothetical protein
VVHFSSACSEASGTIESTLLLKGCVGLEIGGGNEVDNWVEVHYDVRDATEFARKHLVRANIGLPPRWLPGDAPCPFCGSDIDPDWEFKIRVARPVSADFIGEALTLICRPCEKHRLIRNRGLSFHGRLYAWRYGLWLRLHRVAAWARIHGMTSKERWDKQVASWASSLG